VLISDSSPAVVTLTQSAAKARGGRHARANVHGDLVALARHQHMVGKNCSTYGRERTDAKGCGFSRSQVEQLILA
jgi:hypothetical protein